MLDIYEQNLALQLVYIQRLICGGGASGNGGPGVAFLPLWIYNAFQMYTGHQSVLPVLMFPAAYKCRFAVIPTLARLCKLPCHLPVLTLSSSWSARWFMDLALRCVLSNVGAMVSSVDISTFPMRYLLLDTAAWNIKCNVLSGVESPRSPLLRRIRDDLISGSLPLFLTIRSGFNFQLGRFIIPLVLTMSCLNWIGVIPLALYSGRVTLFIFWCF